MSAGRARAWRAALVGVAVAGAGCNPIDCENLGAPALEPGTGWESFVPVANGDDLVIEHGFQGGFHVWGGLRAQGVYAGDESRPYGRKNPLVTMDLTVDGERVAFFEDRRFLAAEGEWLVDVGEVIVFEVGDPPGFDGVPATLTVSVLDPCDVTMSESRDVTLRFALDG